MINMIRVGNILHILNFNGTRRHSAIHLQSQCIPPLIMQKVT